jgi:type VI secretion system protein ImpF
LPSFAGQTASSLNVKDLESAIRESILWFEPRILPASLEVAADENEGMLDCHNVVSVRISAQVWAQPVPFELLLKAEVDLETGLVTPVELAR